MLLFATLLLALPAYSQVATGIPPFSSLTPSSFDTINNANLNVTFSIPILNKAGRGLPFNFALTYNSSFWTPGAAWTPAWNGGMWGWSDNAAADTGSVNDMQSSGICFWSNTQYTWAIWNSFVYFDSSGTMHPFNITISNWAPKNTPCGTGASATGSGVATDGSGYTLSVQALANGTLRLNGLTDRSGNSIGAGLFNGPSGTNTVTDPNGNTLSTDGSGNYYDTLSTTTPVLTVAGALNTSTPRTYTYYGPNGVQYHYTVHYKPYTVRTNYGCSGITEYNASRNYPQMYLVDEIDLPDGTSYKFGYETTLGDNHTPQPDVTARLASVKLPTGGEISYQYAGGSNGSGITCADGSTGILQRQTPDSSNPWSYVHSETGSAWTTAVTDPANNVTTYQFQGIYETQRQVGSLETVNTCYNGAASPCNSTAITSPITQITATTTVGSQVTKRNVNIGTYGLPTEIDEYDWGPTLKRKTITAYDYNTSCGLTNSQILDRACSVTIQDGSGNTAASTTNTYDASGNLLSSTSGGLTKGYSYNSNGTVATATDVNNTQTTYGYGSTSCNGAFPTTITLPLGPAQTLAWDCTGGVLTSKSDVNGTTTYGYTDPFWRVTSIEDQTNATTNVSYTSNSVESSLNFGSNSTVDTLKTLDSLGRVSVTQRKQSQNSGTYDSTETVYDSIGRVWKVSPPYSAGAGGTYPGSSWNITTYDALNRPVSVTDAGGGVVSYSYPAGNDVLVSASPKSTQYQYDGLGRLQSVCEITSATGSGPCSQNATATGFFTSYTYDLLNNLHTVSQSGQTRTYNFDALSRLTSETNPESGTTVYTYDAPTSTCTNGAWNQYDPGNMIQKQDANGNVTCYMYDQLHRLGAVDVAAGPGQWGVTGCKSFEYENTSGFDGWGLPTGVSVSNVAGRLAEAVTTDCAWPPTRSDILTDEWFSYSARGDITDVYESTPHSGGYYHVSESYYANGLPSVLNLYNSTPAAVLPTITYNADGEGRVGSTSVSSGQNPLSSAAYNVFGQPTSLQLGSGDSDAFTFDPNTGRMTQYNFTVSGQSVVGTLGWNSNGTLQQLAITDPFEASNQQTCNYGYDSLARLQSANCGAIWSQSYSPDPFGNLSKSGTITFQPGFNTSTNQANIGSYDADGNLLSDTVHSYSYDADGNAVTIDSIGLTYDAFDRMVEHGNSGTYAEMVYGPQGNKLAIMNGQTLPYAVVPLAGATTAIYNSSGLWFYRHGDWLGSSRLTSLPSGTSRLSYDGAYAPYGESYAETGSIDHQFAGQNADTLPGGPYPLYDFLMREYHPTWGRWITPDPAGLAAVDPSNPQSWNRYAYVVNNPLANIDPLGLFSEVPDGCTAVPNNDPEGTSSVACMPPAYAEMEDYWFRQDLLQFYIDNGSGGGGGGGSGLDELPLGPQLNLGQLQALLPSCLQVTAQAIDNYLANQNSPMNGQGNNFVTSGLQYGVDPRFLVALSGAETSFGSNITWGRNNAFNWGHSDFPSWGAAINRVAKGIGVGPNYFKVGRTSTSSIYLRTYCVGPKCATEGLPNLNLFTKQMGGDPDNVTCH